MLSSAHDALGAGKELANAYTHTASEMTAATKAAKSLATAVGKGAEAGFIASDSH